MACKESTKYCVFGALDFRYIENEGGKEIMIIDLLVHKYGESVNQVLGLSLIHI